MAAAEDEILDRQDKRLNAQQHGMHDSDRIDRVQANSPEESDVLGREQFVIAGVSVGDATAAQDDAVKAAFVKRLQIDQDRAWPRRSA